MELVPSELDCPICLLTCKFPACLPCGHIFCFLCIKGVQDRRCAMCRSDIPAEFFERPCLVNGVEDIFRMTKQSENGYQWFYEGRNGWWQYDDRTSKDIEEAYQKNEKSCTILVAGNVYIVDLETMMQQRQNEPVRCRRVKRDLATVPKKGVAGLRIEGNAVMTDTNATEDALQQSSSTSVNEIESPTLLPATTSTPSLLSPVAAANAAINIAASIPDSIINSDSGDINDGEDTNGENELILSEHNMGLVSRDSPESVNADEEDRLSRNEYEHQDPIDYYERVLIDLLLLQVNVVSPTHDDGHNEHANLEHREHNEDNSNRQT